jgi:IS1 family transposase
MSPELRWTNYGYYKKVAPRTKVEDDGAWMWVGFAPESRLIINFIFGPRKQFVADELVESTDKHLSDSKPLFTTDGLEFYAQALLKKQARKETT